MARGRKSLILVTVALASLVTVTSAAPTQAQTEPIYNLPLTVWDIPSATGLDGYGAWLVTGNDPAAGTGQAKPAFDYFFEVDFTSGHATADLSLLVERGQKYALLTVHHADENRFHMVRVSYPWVAPRYYFLYMARLAPGVWGGYVHDASTGVWTTIGHVLLPTGLEKLKPRSKTGLGWIGPLQQSCSAYPLADIYWMKPLGVVDQTVLTATAAERPTRPHECPSETEPEVPTADFDHYTFGTPPT